MRKVKVLVLITAMDRGGAETMVMNYLRNIDREKVQMDFLVIRKYKSDYEDKIKQMGSNAYIRMQISPSAHLQTVAKARWTL